MKFQHALITGISGELGFNLASFLITNNLAGMLSVCARGDKNDEPLLSLAQKYKVKVNIEHFDIRDDDALSAFITRSYNKTPLDLVIANAGVSLSSDDLGLEDFFEINRGFDINAKATIKTLYKSLALYRKNVKDSCTKEYGRDIGKVVGNDQGKDRNKDIPTLNLVAISSLASLLPMRSSPIYSSSKVAINMYVNALRNSLSDEEAKSVKITLIIPGFIKTAMSDRFIGNKAMMISASDAAKKIIGAVVKNKRQLAFPKILYLGTLLGAFLPNFIVKPFVKMFDFGVVADKDRVKFLEDGIKALDNSTYSQESLKDSKKSFRGTSEDRENGSENKSNEGGGKK